MALLLAGQVTTAYFLYQQQGRLDKLTVVSQNLQLENLRMNLPKCACPTSIPPPRPDSSPQSPHSCTWLGPLSPLKPSPSSSGSEILGSGEEYPLP